MNGCIMMPFQVCKRFFYIFLPGTMAFGFHLHQVVEKITFIVNHFNCHNNDPFFQILRLHGLVTVPPHYRPFRGVTLRLVSLDIIVKIYITTCIPAGAHVDITVAKTPVILFNSSFALAALIAVAAAGVVKSVVGVCF